MIDLRKTKFEYKAAAVLGLSAFVLSLLTGVIMGISGGTIVIRSFLLLAVFAGIGSGTAIVLKTFVPEVYEIFASDTASSKGAADATAGAEGRGERTVVEPKEPRIEETPSAVAGAGHESAPPKVEPAFNELEKDMLSQYSSASGKGDAVDTAAGKLGKHVLKTEKLAKYEPKVMAQAVRTMMSKDQ